MPDPITAGAWLMGAAANPAWDLVKLLGQSKSRWDANWERHVARALAKDHVVHAHEVVLLQNWLSRSDWTTLLNSVEATESTNGDETLEEIAILDSLADKVLSPVMATHMQERNARRERARAVAAAMWPEIARRVDRDTLLSLQSERDRRLSDTRLAGLLEGLASTCEATERHLDFWEIALRRRDRDLGLRRPRTALPPNADESPASLLSAHHTFVKFVGRVDELRFLMEWAAAPGGLSIMTVLGTGGMGKTALAVELCRRLGRARWTTGFLSPEPTVHQMERLRHETRPRLVVIDYADGVSDLSARLEPFIDSQDPRWPTRILLLQRTDRPFRKSSYLLDVLQRSPQPIVLDETPLSVAERIDLFETTRSAVADRHASAAVDHSVDLATDLFARTVFVVGVAYLAARGVDLGPSPTAAVLFDGILEHERSYWDSVNRRRAVQIRDDLFPEAVACGAVFGWASHIPAALDAEAELGRLLTASRVSDSASERSVAAWLLDLYPGGRLPLDPLADYLIDKSLPGAGYGVGLDPLDQTLIGRASGALVRASGYPNVVAQSAVPAARSLETMALTCQRHDAGWMRQPFRNCLRLIPTAPERIATLLRSDSLPPWLAESALDLERNVVELRRTQTAQNPGHLPNLAAALNNLAIRLAEVGERPAALEPAREAVELYRALTEQNPRYHSNLAASLNNLAIRLAEVGERPAALEPAREAVELYRALAGQNPAYLPDLAMALSTLGIRLAEVGERPAALEPAREAVELRRTQAAQNPGHLPDLASALNNLANRLTAVGEQSAALELAREALELRRTQAAQNPGHLPDLAMALSTLAMKLADVDEQSAALEPAREAVELYRALAGQNPGHLPHLAMALNNFAIRLAGMDEQSAALEPAREAVELYRALAGRNPGHLPHLAAALNNLANSLADVDEQSAALEAAREAVELRRTQAAQNPGYLPNLAMALNNLAIRLADVDEPAPALDASRESVQMFRLLAADNRGYLQRLAEALRTLGARLDAVERHEEAEAERLDASRVEAMLGAQ